ncbi:MAG: glycosyltransferase family 4 protein [Euryarchaeota archaeon]|nr:glycosyltransferase family 4 protein [Euryarchaeota archaeon]MDE1835765.1 glycosyltransferase family 4 protein [Euryarchaeota archaeon]MDE1881531.1 glycosyltransferase family 4 protein [Euryarchaeota archaeon]MDE2043956.1 glycosyltransferase family 4 protein [Thermoplasmata archaeon]
MAGPSAPPFPRGLPSVLQGTRVLHVPTRYPPAPGGVERHVREVALRQRARGLDARVLTSDLYTEIPWRRLGSEPGARGPAREGIPVARRRAYALGGDLHYPFLPGLYFEVRRQAPSILHVHTYGTYQGFSGLAWARLNRRPFVMTAHFHPTWSIWGGARRKELRGFYDRHLASHVLRAVSRLILQSREEEALLREVVPDLPPVSFVPPGYTPLPPPSTEGGGFRGAFGIRGPFLLFTGRLASNKGIPLLLDAFGALAPRHPELELVLLGEDGGEGAATRSKAEKLSLASRVHMTGFVKDESLLASAYAQAEAFVLPSEYEAFGLVLLEAMAQGTPVVATRVGGIPSLVDDGKNGRLVPYGDASALASTLEEVLSDRERARVMGRYGRERTVPEHSWERTVEGLEKVYAEVLEERPSRGGRGA